MPNGLIAKKIGMSRVFLANGEAIPVTYLKVESNTVIRQKTAEKDGYNALVLGVVSKTRKSRKGKDKVSYSAQKEWRADSLEGLEAGKALGLEIIPAESMVTISGISKGKGFAGVVKRHGFAGGPATHGSHFHRRAGSIGMREMPGRVLKGHRMAGHMGKDTITLKHRSVVISDKEKGIIAIKGPVPGPKGATVYLTLESAS